MRMCRRDDCAADAADAPGTILMNPAALVRGLAYSLPANADVYEDSPVTSVE